MPDGNKKELDVRTIPLFRFEDNEAHGGFYGLVIANNGNNQPDNLIQSEAGLKEIRMIDWTGPEARHPHVIRKMKIWKSHYAFRPHCPSMLMEDIRIDHVAYGIYRPAFDNHVYRNLPFSHSGAKPFNRSVPYYIHDYFGPGRDAKIVSTTAADLLKDGNTYRALPP